ncbi:FAD:protein FMN transferase [Nonomuraea gerenzanensis]|uniref:FAD:protein FMN transferase n=1 Tax=Nonomuraea gerenzanensis TaxID=93944 RepID=A0A1M4ENA6_9ACTN|nr:FAD:protein FMN transferase [Nonomuraea gerenzanensis]UBU11827.1 FAD:protein FMN transferase [Nonomuraea gerenzanensis]SBP00332.1 Thiamin biosynthesis lipoprotein ApbE [Nonomuraea gerenzanensis]
MTSSQIAQSTTAFPGSARVELVMGRPVSVDIRTALPARELTPLLDDAFAWLRWVDDTFDPARPDSQIARLNRGGTIEQIPELVEVLHRCAELSEATGGWFEPRIGGVTDPSGYIRGWALERLSRALSNAGAGDHRITSGDDIRVRGSSAPGRPWRIGVRDPHSGTVRKVVFAHDLGIATSGGSPVVDPHTGQVVDGLASVTVLGPDLGAADAYATAVHAMGPARGRRFAAELARARAYETMIVLKDGQEVVTPGFLDHSGAAARLAG